MEKKEKGIRKSEEEAKNLKNKINKIYCHSLKLVIVCEASFKHNKK